MRGLISVTSAAVATDTNLDTFKNCFPAAWRAGGDRFGQFDGCFRYVLAIIIPPGGFWCALHFTLNSLRHNTDLSAFSILLVTARKSRAHRYPGIPSLSSTVLQDVIVYLDHGQIRQGKAVGERHCPVCATDAWCVVRKPGRSHPTKRGGDRA